MSKITIYVPAMKLKKIDMYCKEKGINRSKFLANCATSFINSRPGNLINCSYQGCRNPAIGKYKVTLYDWSQGEAEKERNLCEFHFKKASSEGAEIKEI